MEGEDGKKYRVFLSFNKGENILCVVHHVGSNNTKLFDGDLSQLPVELAELICTGEFKSRG